MAKRFDFGGWATKNNIRCSDGRTIRRDAFKDCDGMTVPLVWGHHHDSPSDVLGHALLENRPEGVYAYCNFNDSPAARDAKEAVRHGDIRSLSIFANRLTQKAGDVLHGIIREVSLVYAGANKGAIIDNAVIEHSDGSYGLVDDEAIIYMGEDLDLPDGFMHSDDDDDDDYEEEYEMGMDATTVGDVLDDMTDEQLEAVKLIAHAYHEDQLAHADDDYADDEYADDEYDDDEYADDEYDDDEYDDDEYDDDEYDDSDYDDEVEHSDFDGGDEMYYNMFDGDADVMTGGALSHDELDSIFGDAKTYGSLKESYLAHAADYGIEDIDWLFPEAKEQNMPPEYIKRPDNWVGVVMSGVHHTPFSRLKSTFADITADEARAKGYLKGKLKKEEVFSLLKRTTSPTTVYKKQKMDRDDQIDITDFDVVAWIKAEMRLMLDEELAGAYLVGDGRMASDDDKIKEDCIRPIVSDADLFTIKYAVAPDAAIPVGATEMEDRAQYFAKGFIRAAIKSRKGYKGSGSPTLFTSESLLSEMLLLEDTIGHPLYKTEAELATKMRVSRIVTLPDEILARAKVNGSNVLALIVNLSDYNVGADKGGSVSMFEDFDIDYNQQKYLIETRCSGSLTKPFSAIVLYEGETTQRESAIVGDKDFKAKDLL